MFHWKKKIASDNKIVSDNTIKNSLISFENDFSGLAKVIALFFPEMRHEMVMRYRAETINKIGHKAQVLIENGKIQINPIPPKIALPLIEKMSLEHEPDMYENWARLLIDAGVKPNSIHQQYADILANLNARSANLLKEIYKKQSSPNIEDDYEEDINKSLFQQCYDDIQKHASWHPPRNGKIEYSLPDSFGAIHSFFQYPFILHGTEKRIETYTSRYENDKAVEVEDIILEFSKDDSNTLIGLKKLGLIKYKYLYDDQKYVDIGKRVHTKRCGVLLTRFGYSFVDCLENPMYQGTDERAKQEIFLRALIQQKAGF